MKRFLSILLCGVILFLNAPHSFATNSVIQGENDAVWSAGVVVDGVYLNEFLHYGFNLENWFTVDLNSPQNAQKFPEEILFLAFSEDGQQELTIEATYDPQMAEGAAVWGKEFALDLVLDASIEGTLSHFENATGQIVTVRMGENEHHAAMCSFQLDGELCFRLQIAIMIGNYFVVIHALSYGVDTTADILSRFFNLPEKEAETKNIWSTSGSYLYISSNSGIRFSAPAGWKCTCFLVDNKEYYRLYCEGESAEFYYCFYKVSSDDLNGRNEGEWMHNVSNGTLSRVNNDYVHVFFCRGMSPQEISELENSVAFS